MFTNGFLIQKIRAVGTGNKDTSIMKALVASVADKRVIN